jgi:hypothetical protein
LREKTGLTQNLQGVNGFLKIRIRLVAHGRLAARLYKAERSIRFQSSSYTGRGRRWTQAATPNRAGTHGNRSILHDFEDDRISRHIGNETRSLSLMSALRVNSGTDKQKRPPEGGLGAAIFPLQFCFTKRPKMRFLKW